MRKKIILATAALILAALSMNAQEEEYYQFGFFRHYSLSIGIGSTGISADLGTMISNHAGMRLGIDYMPDIRHSTNLDLKFNGEYRSELADLPDKVEVKGKFMNNTAHALFDVYPFRNSGFHVTVGAYFAKQDKLVSVYSEDRLTLQEVADFNYRQGKYADIPESYGQMALKLGDYDIKPDRYGNADAFINVKKVRPYAGLGFGRAVPGEQRLNCQFDLGCQFWKEPEVYNGVTGERLTKEGAKGHDGGVIETISKIKVFPVISVRLSGRLF